VVVQQDVEQLGVGLLAAGGVFEERVGDVVGGAGPVTEEELPPVRQHGLEAAQALLEDRPQALDLGRVGLVALELVLEGVGDVLPLGVEPRDELTGALALIGLGREQRRLGVALLQPADDPGRVRDHLAVRVDHGHQALTAHGLHQRAVVVGDQDRLGVEALVGQGQADALAVGRPLGSVQADHAPHSVEPVA